MEIIGNIKLNVISNMKKLLCKIYGHKYLERHWDPLPHSTGRFGGLIVDWEEECERCGFINKGGDKWD